MVDKPKTIVCETRHGESNHALPPEAFAYVVSEMIHTGSLKFPANPRRKEEDCHGKKHHP